MVMLYTHNHNNSSEKRSSMKASVTQQHLAHGLSIVSRAVSPRSTLPVLANVLVATDEGRLRLSATNLELGITCWIPAQIQEEGSITVPARTFVDLVSTFPPDKVSLALDARTQTMTVERIFTRHCSGEDIPYALYILELPGIRK